MTTKLKLINYRGGIVRFRVPQHWVEKYEPEGGGTFYEDRPDSGTLRLNVLGFGSPNKTADEMAQAVFASHTVELLASGLQMRRYIKPAEEDGTQLDVHRWEIAVPIPPHSLRIAMFAHTILAGQENDPRIAVELEVLDQCIRTAEFSREQGMAGDFDHDCDD